MSWTSLLPHAGPVAPIKQPFQAANQASVFAAQQQRTQLEQQQTQAAQLANQQAAMNLRGQQALMEWMTGGPSSQSTAQSQIPPANQTANSATPPQTSSASPDYQPLVGGAGLNLQEPTTTPPGGGGPTVDAARGGPTLAAAQTSQQASAAPQAQSRQPSIHDLPMTSDAYMQRIQGAINDPRVPPQMKFALQKQIYDMAEKRALITKNLNEATEQEHKVADNYRDDLLRLSNSYLNGTMSWDQMRQQAHAENMPENILSLIPQTEPADKQIVRDAQAGLRTSKAQDEYLATTLPNMQKEGLTNAAQASTQIAPDGSNYPGWRQQQVANNWTLDKSLPPTWQGSQTKAQILKGGLSPENQLKAPQTEAESQQKHLETQAQIMAAHFAAGPDAYKDAWNTLPASDRDFFPNPNKPDITRDDVLRVGIAPDKQVTEQNADKRAKIAQEQADTAAKRAEAYEKRVDQLVDQGQNGKQATRGQYAATETKKSQDLAKAKVDLDKAVNTGFPTDNHYQEYLNSVQDVQRTYEQKVSELSGKPIEHNPWADKLTVQDIKNRYPGNKIPEQKQQQAPAGSGQTVTGQPINVKPAPPVTTGNSATTSQKPAAPSNINLPKPTTKAERDALPAGTTYIGLDGNKYVKH